MKNMFLILVLCSAGSVRPVGAQDADKDAKPKGLKIDDVLFKNTILNPGMFQSILKDHLKDTEKFEKLIFEAIEFANHLNSKSFGHQDLIKKGEYISFEIVGSSIIVRILTVEQQRSIEKMDSDELPSDLKSKQTFHVTGVTTGFVSVENGATKLAIPVDRVMYFQRGFAPLFR